MIPVWDSGAVYFFDAQLNQLPIADAGPDQELECTSPDGSTAPLNGTGSYDPDGDPLTFQWDVPAAIVLDSASSPTPSGVFPLGTTLATLTVIDDKGGVAVDDVLVTVVDTTPPEVVCTTDVAALWPPNHKMVDVSLFVEATDACSEPEDIVLLLVTVSSDEPDDAIGMGDGGDGW